jgi:acyl-CoA thioester hydrolase
MLKGAERPERGLFVEHDIVVATYDTDFANHVSNIAYLRWFEDMRLKLFDKYFPLKQFIDQGKSPVIASHYIQYKRPIRLFDKPHAVMWVSHIGNASVTIDGEIKVDGQITTVVRHVGVFIDLATGKPIRVPEVCVTEYKNATESIPA